MIATASESRGFSSDKNVEVGTFGVRAPESHPFTTLVIASYNIRYAVGPHLIGGGILRKIGISRPARRAELVSGHIKRAANFFSNGSSMPRPDIIALQEADKDTLRSGRHNIARELADAMNLNYARAASDVHREIPKKSNQWYLDFEEHIEADDRGNVGVAILSGFEIENATRLSLPWEDCPWRPRIGVSGVVNGNGFRLPVVAAHIDPHADTSIQLSQHKALLNYADLFDGPILVLGDFNTLKQEAGRVVKEYYESRGYQTPFALQTPTWRSGPIRLHTDWVFGRGIKFLRCGVARGISVSDHWPIWVEIDLGNGNIGQR
jgi:endonuclease/exonuclease/phosphatase family metal-dependent hydrolase